MIIFAGAGAVSSHVIGILVVNTTKFTVKVRISEELSQHFQLLNVLE